MWRLTALIEKGMEIFLHPFKEFTLNTTEQCGRKSGRLEIQSFVQGELIYIPKKETNRAGWGELNGARDYLRQRNLKICNLFQKGWSIEKLIKHFHLSEDSVRKIISNNKQ